MLVSSRQSNTTKTIIFFHLQTFSVHYPTPATKTKSASSQALPPSPLIFQAPSSSKPFQQPPSQAPPPSPSTYRRPYSSNPFQQSSLSQSPPSSPSISQPPSPSQL